MKRLIKPIPKVGVDLSPPRCAIVDQHIDYITENDAEDETDAVYVCYVVPPSPEAPDGFFVALDKVAALGKHTFAGWPAPKGDRPVRRPRP